MSRRGRWRPPRRYGLPTTLRIRDGRRVAPRADGECTGRRGRVAVRRPPPRRGPGRLHGRPAAGGAARPPGGAGSPPRPGPGHVRSVADVWLCAVPPVGEAGIDFMSGPPLTPLIVVAAVRLAKPAGIEPNVAEYMLTALARVRASAWALARRARAWMFAYSRMAMAATMPMNATTVISPVQVEPRWT